VIQDRKVTTLWLTAALFHQMVDEQIESLQGVRQLLSGGETLSVPHVRRMLEVIGKNRLINAYGPTENTTFTTCHAMTKQSRIEQTVPIGRPVSNTKVYVLDGRMRPVPIGVYGELYIGGAGLAREYLHQPELTARMFVPDPFSGEAGARLYRTGDLVRFRPDGNIEFLGRIDHQVKIRGFRIELGEIESGLSLHPAVGEVAVIAREDTPGDKRLVAYLVAENPPADLADQLRALVRATMPEYMVPSCFVIVESLPRSHNGKLDRKALPAPGPEAPRGVAVSPRTPTEEMVLSVFRSVLDRADFGVFDNFFDLGGHSLKAARLILQLRAASGRDLPLRVLFERPTVSALAEAVDAIAWLANSKQQPAVTDNREEIEL
jgi:acyl-coenzyme A synthetase/AMP-(fatty) acid ligase